MSILIRKPGRLFLLTLLNQVLIGLICAKAMIWFFDKEYIFLRWIYLPMLLILACSMLLFVKKAGLRLFIMLFCCSLLPLIAFEVAFPYVVEQYNLPLILRIVIALLSLFLLYKVIYPAFLKFSAIEKAAIIFNIVFTAINFFCFDANFYTLIDSMTNF